MRYSTQARIAKHKDRLLDRLVDLIPLKVDSLTNP